MLKDPECAARYEEALCAIEAPTYAKPVTVLEYAWTNKATPSHDRRERAALILPKEPTREAVVALQNALATMEQLDLPPKHHFAPGMYGRELAIPADSVVVGKIHRHQHITILLSGTATINTDKGMETITGPHTWISQEGAKRALYTHTDCVFFTCHLNASDTQDLDALEAEIIEPEQLPALTKQGAMEWLG